MNETIINTIPGLNTLADFQPTWSVVGIVFVATLLMIFLLSKNFRQFVYGSVVTGILALNFMFSRWVGTAYSQGNYNPFKWFGYVVGFIVVSIIIGRLLQKTKFIKKIEKNLEIKK